MSEANQKRIFLGMPNYGKPCMDAARGFFTASRDMSRVVKYHPASSLLASNFNSIWCAALNLVESGERLDYFAMLHDDVCPDDFWLDKLIDELEDNALDLLGVAVPIKDSRGMTSMALHKEGDNWLPLARVSMTELYRLPATFTSEDVGHPLLLNTGCWVIRWNQEVCSQLHFEIRDRIVFNRAQKRWQAQTEPEDWFFSRNAHALGLRIGATRKIGLYHIGEAKFGNRNAWGHFSFDAEAVKESPLPVCDKDGFRFPHDVDGWLTFDEGKELWRLSQGKRVLEIGSYCGKSTICIAQSAKHVTAVDYFDGRATPAEKDTFPAFSANLARFGVAEKVQTCHPDAEISLPEYDFAFIDGAHDSDSVKADIAKVQSVLRPGGLLAFHDYRERPGQHDGRWDPGVTQAVRELIEAGGELLSTHDSLAVVRPPAAIPLEA